MHPYPAAPAEVLPAPPPHLRPTATLSVVVPTLNAAAALPGCLAALRPARARGLVDQVVVADGGSTDATREIARDAAAILVASAPGRGPQLAAGARIAAGDWLLFLHADTRLQPGWAEAMLAHMAEPEGAGRAAAFRLAFDEVSARAERVAALANWRATRLGLPYGDQGLLIARALYEAVGGYAELPLMEDVDLVRRLGRRRLVQLPATAVTSAARYRREGWRRRPLRNLALLGLWRLGVPPARLQRLYGSG
jgi:rSAM/selenodomain-associated transferase 2